MNLKKRDYFHSLLVILCLLSTYASVEVAATAEKELELSDAMNNNRHLASSSVWTNFLSKFEYMSFQVKEKGIKEYDLTFLPSFRFASLSASSSSSLSS